MSRQAVLLCGGKGTRLAERLNGLPKPLVDVAGQPLLQRQLLELKAQGFGRALILVNHRADAIADFLHAHGHFGMTLTLVDDGAPRGTAGALQAAIPHLDPRFLVVYGDTLFAVDCNNLWNVHDAAKADATLLLHPNDHPADSDLVEVDAQSRITHFWPVPHTQGLWHRNLVNAALYVMERSLVEAFHPTAQISDLARDLFPQTLAKGAHLHGLNSFEYIKDLGTPARLDKGIAHLTSGRVARARRIHKQRAVFLDRDGTLNVPHGFVVRPEDLHLLPGAGEAVRLLQAHDYRTIVITNQPVIARGDCTFAELDRIHGKLEHDLGLNGAYLDGLYFCPHHPDGGFMGERADYKIRCACRKPGTALVEQAVADFNIDHSQSWFVGDTTRDMLCANQAGVRAILVQTGEAGRDGKYAATAEHTVADVWAAAQLITGGT